MYNLITANIDDFNDLIDTRNIQLTAWYWGRFDELIPDDKLITLIPSYKINTYKLVINSMTQFQYCMN